MQQQPAWDWSPQRQQGTPDNPLFALRASIGANIAFATSVAFAIAIGGFFIVRRATGALTVPLPALPLVATAAGLCIWAWLVHLLAPKRWVALGMSLGVLLLAVGCSYPGGRVVDWAVWLPVIGLISWFPTTVRTKLPSEKRRASSQRAVALEDNLESRPQSGTNGERVLQQLTRFRTVDGRDALRGALAAEFAAGERQSTCYVGFCPPFESMPRVEIDVCDELEADLKLTQVLHNGAQLDVRLNEPAEEPLAVTIEFYAVAEK